MLARAFPEKAVNTTLCGQIALFQMEQFCLFDGVAAHNLGFVVQDHVQQ
jgi:hypothetical protein